MDLDWKDERELDKLPLAMNLPEGAERTAAADRIRAMLKRCGVVVAEDIASVGCTGLASEGFTIKDIEFVRLGLAGSGVGLTCFVPPTLFCRGHNTIGGLQERQKPEHVESLSVVARELTPEERKHRETIEDARQSREGGDRLNDRLAAIQRKLNVEDGTTLDVRADGGGAVAEPSVEALEPDASDLEAQGMSVTKIGYFTCPEHTDAPNFGCRYCLAQALVQGELSPRCLITWDDGDVYVTVNADEVAAHIAKLDADGADAAAVYVRILRWKRQFARV